MSESFDPSRGLIVVKVRIWGPGEPVVARLAVDTGATLTLVGSALLAIAGYYPSASGDHIRVTTGSGVEYVPQVAVERIEALGQDRIDFPVVCHTLPPSASVDGVLGLDFFRGQTLTIDFRSGTIDLA